ncbi:MAG TPA: TonB-dependent receptor [Bacteroidales bacterium]|nr:TonB-dependent receptor [Bacteroidales bacterium]HOL99130.1 TonB-dependent receptor [Bacteroidales bacterium]HOM37416.1 TonB-dependent receptor [Bacteroidales bacterium]HPD24908.1 TonB-dependent receptor [Bacteroidales bacterium]HRT00634.1 TonB-dependent receptor [Bacteroidales bacterium]
MRTIKFSFLFCFLILNALRIIAQEHTDSIVKPENVYIPTILLSDDDLEGGNKNQDISGLLQSSSDVFFNTAGFTFGQARYLIRGYENSYHELLMNGINLSNAETGRIIYSQWGGLNDATRNKVMREGLGFSDFSFGSLMGSTNIITRASQYRTGSSVSYASTNRNYRNRIMVTHSTGMNEKGWAFTFSASTRWAQQGYVPGTFYEGYAYFLATEKKINEKHNLNLTIFGSPYRSGRSGPATLEAYQLTGSNFYNPNWGYQNGKIRNSRVANYHQPRTILSHYWKINNSSNLETSLSYLFGRGGATALNWYDAPDPRPDYYKNLPSYYEEGSILRTIYTDLWQNNENFRQLKWDDFYFANSKNLYTIVDESGIEGNNITGNRAKYIIEERRKDLSRFDFNSVFSHNVDENTLLIAGLNAYSANTHNFKVINDLLGADWWVDIDQFAERDFNDNFTNQTNLDQPNKAVRVGDIFGYNYNSIVESAKVFAQIEKKFRKLDLYFGANSSYTSFYRIGNFRSGLFPINSYGKSKTYNFLNYGVKAGALYKVTGRHIISANGIYMTKPPYFEDVFISPRTRDNVVSNLSSEEIISADLNYIVRYPNFSARITGYYTEINNAIENKNFYHDDYRTFVNYSLSNIDKLFTGIEFGAEAKLLQVFNINTAIGYGSYIYNSRPVVTITRDNSAELIAENRTVYIKNYHIGGTPELAANLGLKYNSPKFWFVGINATYFANAYVSLNPERRTAEALETLIDTDPQIDRILAQEKIDPGYVFDIWGGKSWRVKGKTIGFNASISNILNNTDIITNGFEQLRFSRSNIDKFPNKYYFMYGRTYFINLYYRF